MNDMKYVIEELKGVAARIESMADDLESEVNEQEEEKSRILPFAEMNVLISHGFVPGAMIEIDGERQYVFQGFYEWNHDIVAQFKQLTDDENKDNHVMQDVLSLLDLQDRCKIVRDQE